MKILLEYIKMLQVNFTMISIIKSWCYLARILERFLRSKVFLRLFFTTYDEGKSKT